MQTSYGCNAVIKRYTLACIPRWNEWTWGLAARSGTGRRRTRL